MASASGIKAGEAFVELYAHDNRLVKGLNAASRRLKAWGKSVATFGRRILTAGTAALGAMLGASKAYASMGDSLAKASQRTGIGVERLSELSYAAELSGTDMEALETGVRRMQRTIAEAAEGSKEAQEALAELGLSVQQLIGLSPDQQFLLIADRISKIHDPTMRAAAAIALFGRNGTQLLPMMSEGAAGIEAMARRARELGLVMSTEDAKAAVQFADSLTELWRSLKMVVFTIGASLGPTLNNFIQQALQTIKGIAEWIKANREVVIQVFRIAGAMVIVGGAIFVFGHLLSGLGVALGILSGIITTAITVFGVMKTALAALVTPIGLVIAALTALGGYLIYISGVGEDALSWLGEQFRSLRDTAIAAWKGIGDALAAGDIGLAARILWLTLKMEWQKGVAWLTDKWIGFKEAFMAVATEAVYGTAKILTSAWAGLQTAWVETVAFMSKAWTTFTHHLVTGWRTAQNWIAKKFVQLMAMFDESVDAEAAMRILDEDFAREQRQRDQATQQQLRDIEATRQAKRQAIEQEERGALDVLEEERQRRHVERKRQYDADLKAAEDAVAEAKRQWQEALDAAARKRAEIKETAGPERVKGIGDLDFNLERLSKGSSVAGTFNPFAVAGLSTGGPLERVARAGEETAKHTKKLVQQAQQGKLVFA